MGESYANRCAGTLGVPGPGALPLIGWRVNMIRFLRDPLPYMERTSAAYGAIAGLVHGDTRQIFAVGPEYNHQLLADTSLFYSIFETITPERIKRTRRGIGLLNMNGEQHKQQRRLLQPAFHRKQIESYRGDMVAITQDALDHWHPGATVDVAHAMQQVTVRVAGKTLFGLDLRDSAEDMGLLIKRMLERPFFAPSAILFPFDLPGTPFHRVMANAVRLENKLLALIARKRIDASAQSDVLAALIRARDDDGSGMTDVELLGQTTTLLIAGHEPSSNALAWTLFLLAQHPAVYADLVDELESVLHGDAPTVEQLRLLPLLERYRLQPAPGTRVDWQVKLTLAPTGGMPMQVIAQDRRCTKTSVRGSIHEVVDLA